MYKNTFYFFRMNDEINPWAIHNVEDFLYFCCPECEEKNQSKDLFIKHAIDEHPKSKIYLQIKNEITEELDIESLVEKNREYLTPTNNLPVTIRIRKRTHSISDNLKVKKPKIVEPLENSEFVGKLEESNSLVYKTKDNHIYHSGNVKNLQ